MKQKEKKNNKKTEAKLCWNNSAMQVQQSDKAFLFSHTLNSTNTQIDWQNIQKPKFGHADRFAEIKKQKNVTNFITSKKVHTQHVEGNCRTWEEIQLTYLTFFTKNTCEMMYSRAVLVLTVRSFEALFVTLTFEFHINIQMHVVRAELMDRGLQTAAKWWCQARASGAIKTGVKLDSSLIQSCSRGGLRV